MLSKKMSVVAGPLAHLALPGVALAIIFHFSLFFGVFPFIILGIIFIWFLEKKTKLPLENLAAITFAFGVGSALLILSINEAEEALIGNINNISLIEGLLVISIALIIFYLTNKIYLRMMLINIHEELAQTSGIDINFYNFLYLLAIGLTVAIGVYLVGGLITVALIATPSAVAKNLSNNLKTYQFWAIACGITMTIIGILLGRFYSLPTGPMIVVTGVCFFFITRFF
jgi:ABC-type Mn2+/Zn2+ transport system permease subunit